MIYWHTPQTIDNRTSFELSNGSQIKAASTSGDAGRSEALSLLIIDEAAHIDGLDDLWTGLYTTLSRGGRCIALSTPNGAGNSLARRRRASPMILLICSVSGSSRLGDDLVNLFAPWLPMILLICSS